MQPYTLSEMLVEISLDYDFNATIISSGNEQDRRIALLNRYIDEWAVRKNYRWAELLKTDTLSTDGTVNLELPSDFTPNSLVLDLAGEIRVGSTYYTLINSNEIQRYNLNERKVCYFTGNPASGYLLTFSEAPTGSVTINYYSNDLATNSSGVSQGTLVDTTDKTKCPRPRFAVYKTLSALFRVDEDIDAGRSIKFETLAEQEMNLMLGLDNAGAINQTSVIEDGATLRGYPGIGA